MTKKNSSDKQVARLGKDLRRDAEALLKGSLEKFTYLSSPEQQALLHELHVHQIELEMQNAELQRAYGELETARDHYADLYNFAPVGFLTVGVTGIIKEANLTITQMLRIERTRLLSQPLPRFLAEPVRDDFYLNLRKILNTEKPIYFDTRMTRSDGTQFDVRFDMIIKSLGEERTVQIAISDISERKEAETRFLLTFESSPHAIILVDRQGQIALVNLSAERSFGYERAELLRMKIEDLIPERFRIEHVRQRVDFYSQPQLREMGERRELFAIRKNGSEFPVEISLAPIETRAGSLVLARVMDITERKQAEADLRRSNERLRALTNRLDEVEETGRRRLARELHDRVGQTLTALNINLNIIKSQIPSYSAERLYSRINDSIQLLEETGARVRNVMADLDPPVLADWGLVAALHDYAETFTQRTEIPVRVEETGETEGRLAPHIETVLFRVTQEALTNVVRYADARRVTVKLNISATVAKLTIEDDGRGFDPAVVVTTAKGGWGLRIMQERIRGCGGTFLVESQPGHGTKIIVEVPTLVITPPINKKETK